MNMTCLTGNLTKDPELRYSSGNNPTAVCRFTIAVNDGYGEKRETSYIPIVVFGKSAESCDRYLRKGSKAAVTGRIKTGSYTKQDGTKVYTTDVIASNVEFISGTEQAHEPQQQSFDTAPRGFEAMDSDIPF